MTIVFIVQRGVEIRIRGSTILKNANVNSDSLIQEWSITSLSHSKYTREGV